MARAVQVLQMEKGAGMYELKAELLKQMTALLDGGQAHVRLEDVMAAVPRELHGARPAGLPYSPWQLLEHLRIAQRDILDFSRNFDGQYKHLDWPGDYWPTEPAPADDAAWDRAVEQIREDREAFEALLAHGDLTTPFAWGDGQNLLREALLIADHNAYHTGELVVLLRLLNAWKPQP